MIGQGTWEMERQRAASIAALRRGLDLGMTHIDTAEMYGGGKVEELVGEAIAGRRHEVFLVSKVLPEHASRQGTVDACVGSLRRLRTDYLDCYLLHWPSRHPLAGTIAAFEQLVGDGKIKTWGVSNFDEDRVEEAVRLAGPNRVACNQVLYHLGERTIEHYILPTCERHRLAVVAYSPFGQGNFRANRVLEEIVGSAVLLEDDDDVLDLPPLGDGAGRIATAPIHIEQESACRKHQTRGIQECGMAHA